MSRLCLINTCFLSEMSHSTGWCSRLLLFQAVKSCGISWEAALTRGCAKAFYLCPPWCERHPHVFTNHVADEKFSWKVLEQLNKLSKPPPASQHKGQVLGLSEVSSPTSGTFSPRVSQRPRAKRTGISGDFFPLEVGSRLVLSDATISTRVTARLEQCRMKKCKKWQLCNLCILLRSSSWPPSKTLPIPCWDVLASLGNWEPEISPALLKCSLWKQNNRDASKSFHLQWKL